MNWKESVFSDGTALFVDNREPELGEWVFVRIRFFKESPVEEVFLKLFINGEQKILCAKKERETERFFYYQCGFQMTQHRLQYEFLLKAQGHIYYYNQAGLFDYVQDLKHDFVITTYYHTPEWIKNAVFYQIFPDRFANGDPSLTVKDGEYQVNGYDTQEIKEWNKPAGTYEEVHCADFYGGDLIGIKEKIPYLKRLGITAVYLNPIFKAPSVHKYDCIDYLHVDEHLGGDEGLIALSEALHENGMRLILDISINHTGTAHKWFNKDCLFFGKDTGAFHNKGAKERDYYMIREDGSYECWDNVPELPKLDFTSEALKDALYRSEDSVLKKWLKPPYHIDGWRFDVADVMANFNEKQLAGQIWPEICKHIRSVNPDAYILAEHWDDCTDFLQGDAWDAPMNYYGFGRIIRQFYGSPDPFTERDEQIWPFTCGMSAEGYRTRVESYLSRLPFPIWQNQYNLFDSHDIGRFLVYPGMNEQKYKGAVLALFTMIGIPSVYYGDEVSIGGAIGFFEGARYPMPWSETMEQMEMFKFHSHLAHLRQEHNVFSDGSFRFLYAKDQVIAFARFDENEAFVTVLSANEQETEIVLPVGVLGIGIQEEVMIRLDPLEACLLQIEAGQTVKRVL